MHTMNDLRLSSQDSFDEALSLRVEKKIYLKPEVALFVLETEEINGGATNALESQGGGVGYLS